MSRGLKIGAAAIAALVLVATPLWPLTFLILFLVAIVAAVPRVGPGVLRFIGWSRWPIVGSTTGLAAAGILLLSSIAVGMVGNAVAPVPSSSPRPASAATTPPASRAPATGAAAAGSSTLSPAQTAVPRATATTAATPGPGAATDQPSSAITAGTPPIGGSAAAPMPTSCHMSATGLPDPACTPGATNPAVTQATIGATICVSGYTTTIRPSSSYTDSLKVQQMKLYGVGGTTADFEEDHLIPLEAGGDPRDPRNLWPEPWNDAGSLLGARSKDKVENWARDQICSGKQTLTAVQQLIASNWLGAYAEANGSAPIAGPATASPGATPAPASTAAPTPAPATNPAPAATFSVTITASDWGSLAAVTTAGATCTATARYANGNLSVAQGITATHVADGNGAVSWTYTRTASTTKGTGTHTVTCSNGGQTKSASAPFTVQ